MRTAPTNPLLGGTSTFGRNECNWCALRRCPFAGSRLDRLTCTQFRRADIEFDFEAGTRGRALKVCVWVRVDRWRLSILNVQ